MGEQKQTTEKKNSKKKGTVKAQDMDRIARPSKDGSPGMLTILSQEWEVYPFLLLFALWFSLMLKGSLWNDEVIYVTSATSILHGHIFVNLEHPPLAKYIIALGLLALGENEVGARAPAILFGLGTLYLTYKCARMLGGRAQALICMILLGMTGGFATFAVQAMLDIYLTFFALLLFYLLLRFEKERPDLGGKAMWKWNVGFGVVSALLLLTKFYAVFFVAVAFIYLLLRYRGYADGRRKDTADISGKGTADLRRQGTDDLNGKVREELRVKGTEARCVKGTENLRDNGTKWSRFKRFILPMPTAKFLWLGFLITIGFFYLPYLIRPDLLVYYIVGWNAAHVAIGHDVVVGDLVYRYPPVFTYFYWIYAEALVYLIALAFTVFFMLKELRQKKLDPVHRVYLAYTLIPLVALSLFTIKSFRYILPLFPLLAIGVFPLLPIQLGKLAKWFFDGGGWRISEKAIAIGAIVAVVLLVFAIPSPVIKTLNKPDIGIDSHYREASDLVAQFCEENPGVTIEVVSFYSQSLNFYLASDHPEIKNVHVVNLYYNSSAILESLKEGRVHLVVDKQVNVRYQDTELHAYVRDNALSSVHLGGDLALFVMRYP